MLVRLWVMCANSEICTHDPLLAPHGDYEYKEGNDLKNYKNINDGIVVKTPFWWELPKVTLRKEIAGTEYSISGSYDGSQTLPTKLLKIMMREEENGIDK